MHIVNFSKSNGLIPAIIQDAQTKDVLMLGYMNQEALDMTMQTRIVHFYSRSKQRIWKKGETSGNTLEIVHIYTDCDTDAVLIYAQLHGSAACHTGKYSCFYTLVK